MADEDGVIPEDTRGGGNDKAAAAGGKEPARTPVTLPLTEDAIRARADRHAPAARLVLGGRPETAPASPSFLRAKYQVGNASAPVDFARKQVVFHRDDIPAAKLAGAAATNAWKKALSGRCGVPTTWNISVQKPDVLCLKRSRENAANDRSNMYQFNFRAEIIAPSNLPHVPKPSKFGVSGVSKENAAGVASAKAASRLLSGQLSRTQEMPVHPKLEGKGPWVAVSSATAAEQRALVAREHGRARASTARASQRLGPAYMGPEARHAEYARQVRVLKTAGPTEGYLATLEAKAAVPKHNRLAKEPSKKERVFAHSGTYAYREEEKAWMWSDTGSFDAHGPGDIASVNDPVRLNFAAPNTQ